MFEFEFGRYKTWQRERRVAQKGLSRIDPDKVAKIRLLHWQEHCIECAIPECFETCSLFADRGDFHCARFEYGVVRNSFFSGALRYGADIRFKRWAKLETQLFGACLTIKQIRLLDYLDYHLSSLAGTISAMLGDIIPNQFPNRLLTSIRRRVFEYIRQPNHPSSEQFVVECFSPEERMFRMILEYWRDSLVCFRHTFEIKPGFNFYSIPSCDFSFADQTNPVTERLSLFPENDAEVRVIFTWLDFVHLRTHKADVISDNILADKQFPSGRQPQSADKIKCVAWDLDNTLWDGILIETEEQDIKIRPEALALIHSLDNRGILQTIVSKNDHDQALRVIKRLGLIDYFLYPAINWGSKSRNIRQIGRQLNINLDTFALIDDSAFERDEVKIALPMVRVFPDTDIPSLLSRSEFDVPITEMSSMRRKSYLSEMVRTKFREEFDDDYKIFLRNCQMRLTIFIPKESKHRNRCHELLQRSNQLNLSTRRYSREAFETLLTAPEMLCVALHCEDRFGDYGVVGFCSVDESLKDPKLVDFVISCRVAQKQIEHGFIHWLAKLEKRRGFNALQAEFIKTKRNNPIIQVFRQMPFEVQSENHDHVIMQLRFNDTLLEKPVVTVVSDITA